MGESGAKNEFSEIMRLAMEIKSTQMKSERSIFNKQPRHVRNTLFHLLRNPDQGWQQRRWGKIQTVTEEVEAIGRALEMAETWKDEANAAFREGRCREAIDLYEQSLGVFVFYTFKPRKSSDHGSIKKERSGDQRCESVIGLTDKENHSEITNQSPVSTDIENATKHREEVAAGIKKPDDEEAVDFEMMTMKEFKKRGIRDEDLDLVDLEVHFENVLKQCSGTSAHKGKSHEVQNKRVEKGRQFGYPFEPTGDDTDALGLKIHTSNRSSLTTAWNRVSNSEADTYSSLLPSVDSGDEILDEKAKAKESIGLLKVTCLVNLAACYLACYHSLTKSSNASSTEEQVAAEPSFATSCSGETKKLMKEELNECISVCCSAIDMMNSKSRFTQATVSQSSTLRLLQSKAFYRRGAAGHYLFRVSWTEYNESVIMSLQQEALKDLKIAAGLNNKNKQIRDMLLEVTMFGSDVESKGKRKLEYFKQTASEPQNVKESPPLYPKKCRNRKSKVEEATRNSSSYNQKTKEEEDYEVKENGGSDTVSAKLDKKESPVLAANLESKEVEFNLYTDKLDKQKQKLEKRGQSIIDMEEEAKVYKAYAERCFSEGREKDGEELLEAAERLELFCMKEKEGLAETLKHSAKVRERAKVKRNTSSFFKAVESFLPFEHQLMWLDAILLLIPIYCGFITYLFFYL